MLQDNNQIGYINKLIKEEIFQTIWLLDSKEEEMNEIPSTPSLLNHSSNGVLQELELQALRQSQETTTLDQTLEATDAHSPSPLRSTAEDQSLPPLNDPSTQDPSSSPSLSEVAPSANDLPQRQPNISAIAKDTKFFSGTNLYNSKKKEYYWPTLYVAKITNVECHCKDKCGKYKVGYVTSQFSDKLPPYHRSRIKAACPMVQFFWYFFSDILTLLQ